jgi:hypothetical protein
VRWGHVAVPRSSSLFKRWIYVIHGVRNPQTGVRRHFFYAADRIGYGSSLDFWMPTNGCMWWGRRTVAYRLAR